LIITGVLVSLGSPTNKGRGEGFSVTGGEGGGFQEGQEGTGGVLESGELKKRAVSQEGK